jgi:hypothetical protein
VLKNKIFPKRFAKPAVVHLVGEKSGKGVGTKFNIVARGVKNTK